MNMTAPRSKAQPVSRRRRLKTIVQLRLGRALRHAQRSARGRVSRSAAGADQSQGDAMSHRRIGAALLAASALFTAAPAALASGGKAGGGGGGGGGGGSSSCTPLVMSVGVGHSDSGASGVAAVGTITNCSTTIAPLQLTVSVPGSGTVPAKFSAPFQAGGSLTVDASPIGSTPLLLHYGQTNNVVATLTQTGANPTVVSTITTPVTMPPGPVR